MRYYYRARRLSIELSSNRARDEDDIRNIITNASSWRNEYTWETDSWRHKNITMCDVICLKFKSIIFKCLVHANHATGLL